jgi:hypothetical protein
MREGRQAVEVVDVLLVWDKTQHDPCDRSLIQLYLPGYWGRTFLTFKSTWLATKRA